MSKLTSDRNPAIASKVHALTHRCHLPSPNIFDELPRIHFHSQTLSQDERLHTLLRLAIRNLVNVHTLRIVFGHMHLASLLVAGFLEQNRSQCVPLRKLWLENCCLSQQTMRLLSHTRRMNGLESLRIRRVDATAMLSSRRDLGFLEFRPSRGGMYYQMHDGAGNWAPTTVQFSGEGMSEEFRCFTDEELVDKAKSLDDVVWQEQPEVEQLVAAHQNLSLGDEDSNHSLPPTPLEWLLFTSQKKLTQLGLGSLASQRV
jgi:hypothetical protein